MMFLKAVVAAAVDGDNDEDHNGHDDEKITD